MLSTVYSVLAQYVVYSFVLYLGGWLLQVDPYDKQQDEPKQAPLKISAVWRFLMTVQKNVFIQATGTILSLKLQYIKYKSRTQNPQNIQHSASSQEFTGPQYYWYAISWNRIIYIHGRLSENRKCKSSPLTKAPFTPLSRSSALLFEITQIQYSTKKQNQTWLP